MVLELKVSEDGLRRDSLRLDRPALERLTALRPSRVLVLKAASDERRRTEQFLEGVYGVAFGGTLASHYPVLISVQQENGAILAAAGYRLAGDGPLFLEQYLAGPIEGRMRGGPARDQVAEIGNLGSASLGASLFMMLAMMDHLDRAGCTHAAVTATAQLRQTFARLGFAGEVLAQADPARLADGGASWGRYYHHDPAVIAGALGRWTSRLGRLILPAADDDVGCAA